MLKGLARSAVARAVRQATGVPQAGSVSTALLTTGASLLLVRGKRPLGLALVAAGGLLRWREIERVAIGERSGTPRPVRRRPQPARDASPATGLR